MSSRKTTTSGNPDFPVDDGEQAPTGPAPLRILLVDDDELDRRSAIRLLRLTGIPVVVDEAGSGGEALEKVLNSSYDCVLQDYLLPDTDGIALLQAVRQAAPETPVVMLTGHGSEEAAVAMMKAGAADYISKAALSAERLAASLRWTMGMAREASARRRAEAELRESEERLRRAFEIETVGIIYFNTEGEITGANDAFLGMGGYTREDLEAGRLRWDELTPPEWMPHSLRAVEEFRTTGRTKPYEKEYFHKNGGRWHALFAATRLNEREGVEFIVDISERKRAERERQALLDRERDIRAQAERSARMRDEVMGIVAHDLRNPINTILTAAAILAQPVSDERRARYAGVVRKAAKEADRLIGDLLDVTKIESGTFTIQPTQVPVQSLFDETLELFTIQVEAGDAALASEVAEDVPPISADRGRLVQVLANLIGNSLKFSPTGSPIRLQAFREHSEVRISVTDAGTGIPAENLPHLFDRFWQADRASRAGAGLGLAICRGIVEAHGGRIWVESAVGVGTTFHFTVPGSP